MVWSIVETCFAIGEHTMVLIKGPSSRTPLMVAHKQKIIMYIVWSCSLEFLFHDYENKKGAG